MRRKLAVAALAAGMIVIGGCSEAGGRSTGEICDEIHQSVDPLNDQLIAAIMATGAAAAQGEDAALAQAVAQLDEVVGQITSAVRDGADAAATDEFRQALREFATELETQAAQVSTGGAFDVAAYGAATDRVGSFCGGNFGGMG